MRLLEEFNYQKMKFREEANFTTNDINNVFITEELLLEPLYKKIKIDKNTKVYNFFHTMMLELNVIAKNAILDVFLLLKIQE